MANKTLTITNEEAEHLARTGLAIATDIKPAGDFISEIRTTSSEEAEALTRELNTNGPHKITK